MFCQHELWQKKLGIPPWVETRNHQIQQLHPHLPTLHLASVHDISIAVGPIGMALQHGTGARAEAFRAVGLEGYHPQTPGSHRSIGHGAYDCWYIVGLIPTPHARRIEKTTIPYIPSKNYIALPMYFMGNLMENSWKTHGFCPKMFPLTLPFSPRSPHAKPAAAERSRLRSRSEQFRRRRSGSRSTARFRIPKNCCSPWRNKKIIWCIQVFFGECVHVFFAPYIIMYSNSMYYVYIYI